MKILLVNFLFLLIPFLCQAKEIVVVEQTDNSPLQGATVIGKSGLIVGLTNEKGEITSPSVSQYPLTIQYIGFEPITIDAHSDTIALTPAEYSLSEIVVNPYERPIKRMTFYAREYASGATGSDTLQLFTEYMFETFLVDSDAKVKGYKKKDSNLRLKNLKRYARYTNSAGLDSISKPDESDEITMLSWKDILSVPNFKIKVDNSRATQSTNLNENDSLGSPTSGQYQLHKRNGVLSFISDPLTQYKDHKWSPFFLKLLGLTIDVDEMLATICYRVNEADSYSIDDFIYETYSMRMLARGKVFKRIFRTDQPILMNTYIELYPVSSTYITVDEYAEMRRDKTSLPFEVPTAVRPLSPAITSLITRLDQ